jgi:hypothetical protein
MDFRAEFRGEISTPGEAMKKAPFIDNKDTVTLKHIIKFSDHLSLTRDEKNWIHSLYVGLSEDEDGYISLGDYAEGKTLSAVRKRINKLSDCGLFVKINTKIPNVKRPIVVYRFRPFNYESSAQMTNELNRQELIPAYSQGDDLTLPSPYQAMRVDPKVDNLFCSVLYSALLFSSPRKEIKYPLHTWVNWFETLVEVYTRCKSGRSIARVSDLRYFIVSISMCAAIIKEKLARGENPRNLFTLEATQINYQMERESDGGNNAAIYRALKRFSATSFEIPNLPEQIVNRLGFDRGDIELEMLTNLGRFQKENDKGRKITVFTFSIPEVLYQSILGGNFTLFNVNPEILHENNDVIFGLHLYGKRRLNYTTKPVIKTLKELHQAIAPTISFIDFSYKLHEGLIARYEETIKQYPGLSEGDEEDRMIIRDGRKKGSKEILQGRVNVYGIIISIRGQDAYLVIDPADPYVGALSKSKRINKGKSEGKIEGSVLDAIMIQQRIDGL